MSDFNPETSSRYVLVYSARTAPLGYSLVPQSVEILAKEQSANEDETHCCESFGTWSDPHLTHLIHLVCPNPKCLSKDRCLTASDIKLDEENVKYHLAVSCNKEYCPGTTKVRILRRGRGPLCIGGGDHKPMLEVEVTGEMIVSDSSVSSEYFSVYAVDPEGSFHKTDILTTNSDGSWDLEIEGGRGTVEGFKGQWQRAEWNDDYFDKLGLRITDEHTCPREGWPPIDWSSGSSGEEEEQGGPVEGNDPANGNDGNGGDGNEDDDGGDYIPSDAESAA